MRRFIQSKQQSSGPMLLSTVLALSMGLAPVLAADEKDSATTLRYGWKTGEPYYYSVKVRVSMGSVVEVLEGVSTYTVHKADSDGFVLVQRGHLNEKKTGVEGRRVRRGINRMGRSSPFKGVGIAGIANATTIHMDPFGKIERAKGSSQLPFMLGNLAELVLIPLSPDGASSWESKQDCTLSLIVADIRRTERDNYPGVETSTYTVAETNGNSVRIKKKYDLKTETKSDDEPILSMTGNGEIVFDRKQGVPRSMEFKASLRQSSGQVSVRIPITVSFKLLEGKERQQLLASARQAAAAAAERNKPLTGAALRAAIVDLKSSDKRRERAAAERLAKSQPNEQQAEVAKVLEGLLEDKDVFTRASAAKALAVWATPENFAALAKAAEDDSFGIRGAALEGLAKLKTAEAAEVVAKRLFDDRMNASKALKSMGTVAEKAVIPYLKDREWTMRLEACHILKEIGTRASAKDLRAATKDKNGLVANAAKEALLEAIDRKK